MARKELLLNNFDYNLPEERIAQFPLARRDSSKLLFYNQGEIFHKLFSDLPELLPPDSSLFLNDTKVVKARLLLQKESGANIEIFLLNPIKPHEVNQSMMADTRCTWKCMIGNLKRWKGEILQLYYQVKKHNDNEEILKNIHNILYIKLLDRAEGIVEFQWNSGNSFAEVLQISGNIPLPPYLKRKTVKEDNTNYQTVYSLNPGGVAAPTAGLHFTPSLLNKLKKRSIDLNFLTLHVSAGTFKPVTEEYIVNHPMHSEEIIISKSNVENLLGNKRVIAVGTTSMRTLESIYWFGVKLRISENKDFFIPKNFPYQSTKNIAKEDALNAVLSYFDETGSDFLIGNTEIFIYPGYKFRICKGLITNFHLPRSSLLMLVSAFIGDDWKLVYGSALENNYRFLSYGDSSFLLPIS